MKGDFFILNPAAGHGRAGRAWNSLSEAALRLAPGSCCAATEYPGHASVLAREAVLAGAARLIAVGGDGTFSEMLEGVMAAPGHLRREVALGTIPAGSGCDLARHLGYPTGREGVLDLLARGRPRALDVGLAEFSDFNGGRRRRHFINIAAFGLAGDVAHHVKARGKFLGGTVSYALSSAWALLGAKAKAVRLKADGLNLFGRYYLGVLANTSSMGGGMLIAPGAADDDGFMDLVLVPDMSRLSLLRAFPGLYGGTHLNFPGVTLTRVRRLEAEADETVYLNLDGEADGMLPAAFETLPGAVKVLAPSGRATAAH